MNNLEARFGSLRDKFGELVQLNSKLDMIRQQYVRDGTKATTGTKTRARARRAPQVRDHDIVNMIGPIAVAFAERIPEFQRGLDQFEADLGAWKHSSAPSLNASLVAGEHAVLASRPGRPVGIGGGAISNASSSHMSELSMVDHPRTDKASSHGVDHVYNARANTRVEGNSEQEPPNSPEEATARPNSLASQCKGTSEDAESSETETSETTARNGNQAANDVTRSRHVEGDKRKQRPLCLDSTFQNRVVLRCPSLNPATIKLYEEADYFGVQYGARSGDFDNLPKRPSVEEAINFLENLIRAPLKHPISYYGGGGTSPLDYMLHPGETLARCKELYVANTSYYHIGAAYSSTAFYCEDADFLSCNITNIGYKI
ncbi:uncharacterized protein F5Z01DRAFT_640631 [Emericellopsis atlantica]|uniref:Uncharacterized protein n=1 Tax=Emericellopsis atlantica TaxID=2614577 RepID=A0A9P8CKL1_9HYPO|nr:uncharacterized protein F5Z01DRAFT_640631 [Emericellopsis atlantica]KAG9250050.1 hypothetical protein F5Z01DRAFT_640631 [Emericellopsis atlantica]